MQATIQFDSSHLEELAEQSAERVLKKLFESGSVGALRTNGEFMTNDAAMVYLGLSRPTLQRYRDTGLLPFSKIGRKVFYRRADIDSLLESGIRSRKTR